MGAAWERHAKCESAFRGLKACVEGCRGSSAIYSEGDNNVLNKVQLKLVSLFNKHTLRVISSTYVSIFSLDNGFITSGCFTTYPLIFEYLKITIFCYVTSHVV